ncbi:Sterile alpha motif (SAM) domain-containing protein [Zea mays]|uniref:Sterile alpha motif (SAM) domain-containing protein n=1 Tax=Zea mays TaxID=4577 RepID=A0A1D6LF87_MAIZE|nr:Sterile alpha motif (SAM) domain-containing protein [Zea mays]
MDSLQFLVTKPAHNMQMFPGSLQGLLSALSNALSNLPESLWCMHFSKRIKDWSRRPVSIFLLGDVINRGCLV